MKKPCLLYSNILQYQPDNKKLLAEHFDVVELDNPSIAASEMLATIDVLLAPLGYFCGKEIIDQAKNLKIIASNTTGDSHIDTAYARSKGIKVITLKDHQDFLVTITPTAELTWGLIILLTRNIISARESVLAGLWNRRPFGGPAMLSRMRIGVAGLGRLGRRVANYAKTFGMNVSYYDPFVSIEDKSFQKVDSLKELVAENDIITIHIPHLPQTENMFNKDIFNCFKDGSFLVNTSRGELVDHCALLEALKQGRLAGAAVDVFEDEFSPGFPDGFKDHPLLTYAQKNKNLIITPHIGGSTLDAWRLTEKYIIDLVVMELSKG